MELWGRCGAQKEGLMGVEEILAWLSGVLNRICAFLIEDGVLVPG